MNLPIRVVIVDDHPMVAQGIQSVLESYSELEIVGTLNNGRAVVDPDGSKHARDGWTNCN